MIADDEYMCSHTAMFSSILTLLLIVRLLCGAQFNVLTLDAVESGKNFTV